MNKKSNRFAAVLSVFGILFFAFASANAQLFIEDNRPFDFSDKYYEENGIWPSTLIDRRNGADGLSVFDVNYDTRFSNVRITATRAAYTETGAIVFWNHYAGAVEESFMDNAAGGGNLQQAFINPIYIFPSSTVRGSDRQAAMIEMTDSYFPKNPLGISAMVIVEFTPRIFTAQGRKTLQILSERNGLSLDGTPIIRTKDELNSLHNQGLVALMKAGLEPPSMTPFVVGKILDETKPGIIAGDAFLMYVSQDGKPIDAEAHILSKFECLQRGEVCF